jgi:hypothetical protein
MGFFDFLFPKTKPSRPAPKAAESNTDHITRHCFVLCRDDAPGDLSQAARVTAQVFGRGYSAEVGKEGIVTVSRGSDTVGFIAHMPAPIPGGEAEANADRNFSGRTVRKRPRCTARIASSPISGPAIRRQSNPR